MAKPDAISRPETGCAFVSSLTNFRSSLVHIQKPPDHVVEHWLVIHNFTIEAKYLNFLILFKSVIKILILMLYFLLLKNLIFFNKLSKTVVLF